MLKIRRGVGDSLKVTDAAGNILNIVVTKRDKGGVTLGFTEGNCNKEYLFEVDRMEIVDKKQSDFIREKNSGIMVESDSKRRDKKREKKKAKREEMSEFKEWKKSGGNE